MTKTNFGEFQLLVRVGCSLLLGNRHVLASVNLQETGLPRKDDVGSKECLYPLSPTKRYWRKTTDEISEKKCLSVCADLGFLR